MSEWRTITCDESDSVIEHLEIVTGSTDSDNGDFYREYGLPGSDEPVLRMRQWRHAETGQPMCRHEVVTIEYEDAILAAQKIFSPRYERASAPPTRRERIRRRIRRLRNTPRRYRERLGIAAHALRGDLDGWTADE